MARIELTDEQKFKLDITDPSQAFAVRAAFRATPGSIDLRSIEALDGYEVEATISNICALWASGLTFSFAAQEITIEMLMPLAQCESANKAFPHVSL